MTSNVLFFVVNDNGRQGFSLITIARFHFSNTNIFLGITIQFMDDPSQHFHKCPRQYYRIALLQQLREHFISVLNFSMLPNDGFHFSFVIFVFSCQALMGAGFTA